MCILDELVALLKSEKIINRIILFGSRSNGKFRDSSDYDLCIVINNKCNDNRILKIISEFMIENKILIHPYIFSADEFEIKKNMSIYKKNILDSGKIIYSK